MLEQIENQLGANPQINTFHDSNFKVVISNIPTLEYEHDLDLFHNFVRRVVLPGFSIDMIESVWRGEHYQNPGSHKNDALGDITITFKVNENLMNYFYMAKYVMDMRYEYADNITDDPQDRMKMNFIKTIDVMILDNQKRHIANIKLSRCFPTNITSLTLEYTNGDEVEFDVTFKITEIHFGLTNEK